VGRWLATASLGIGVVAGVLAGHSVAEADGHHVARMVSVKSRRPPGLALLGRGRESMLEARPWRPSLGTGGGPRRVLERKLGRLKWDSLVEGALGSWIGARGRALESGSWPSKRRRDAGGGSGGDKGCPRVDSPSSRLSEEFGVGVAWDTGRPVMGWWVDSGWSVGTNPSAIQGWGCQQWLPGAGARKRCGMRAYQPV
jgi:hypothetical protein